MVRNPLTENEPWIYREIGSGRLFAVCADTWSEAQSLTQQEYFLQFGETPEGFELVFNPTNPDHEQAITEFMSRQS